MGVSTFQRLYPHAAGEEYAATPTSVENVLRSMAVSKDGPVPFRVRLRMEDGSMVTVAPKGWRK